MEVVKTGIEGLVEIIPNIYQDDRGWFCELYRDDQFKELGLNYSFVQDNQSFSKKKRRRPRIASATTPPHAQAKLVAVITGKVLDVVVDLRKGSATFGKVHYCILDAVKRNLLMVPDGFAHGFAALEDSIFYYKCSNLHHPKSELGILWRDPALNIDWQVSDPLVSEKDQNHPTLDELLRKISNFTILT